MLLILIDLNLWTHAFLLLCDEMGSMQTATPAACWSTALSWKAVMWDTNRISCFSHGNPLQLKEWLTVNLWLFRLWYLVTNWQKWSASVQSRKTTDMFAANDKIRVREFRIMENLSSPLWTSQLPNKLKNSLMRLVVVLMNMIFLDFIEWIMSTFGSSAYLGEPIFSEWLMHAVRIN